MPHFTPVIDSVDAADAATFNSRFTELSEAIDDVLDGALVLSAPSISSLTNSQHDHTDAANGGQIPPGALTDGGGSEGQVLKLASGVWVPASADLSVLTEKGGIAVHNGSDVQELEPGTDYLPLVYNSTLATGLGAGAMLPWGMRQRGVQVYKSANQSFTELNLTTVSWNSEDRDDGGYHDTSTNNERLTALVAGRWGVYFNINLDMGGSGYGYVRIRVLKNGSAIREHWIYMSGDGGTWTQDNTSGAFCSVEELALNEYVSLDCIQENNSSGSISMRGGATESFFGMTYLGTS